MGHVFWFCLHQRKAKYSENKLKALKARNEYLLTLEATNASVFKYYIHDLPDIIDVSGPSQRLSIALCCLSTVSVYIIYQLLLFPPPPPRPVL